MSGQYGFRNEPGWWDDNDVWHDGFAFTHTRTSTDVGPDYCRECTEARGEWVRWPCRLSGEQE